MVSEKALSNDRKRSAMRQAQSRRTDFTVHTVLNARSTILVDPFNFQNLADRHPGITAAIGASYEEAARVCLDRHHTTPTKIEIRNAHAIDKAPTEWAPTDERTREAWANEIDTTEFGAYCFALAAIERVEGMVALRRAETKTGADYYIGPVGEQVDHLESSFRLEVSGVDKGDSDAIQQRLKQKLRQTANGSSNVPALAAVVGFRVLYIAIARAEPE